jgi:hypothetical protein
MPHALPQVPQLFGSLPVSTQAGGEPHIILLPAHTQTPAVHVEPAVHGFAQPPQLLLSVLVFTHSGGLPHVMKPCPVQVSVHCPFMHAPMHVVLQLPQCWGSELVLTQPAAHLVWFEGQVGEPPEPVVPPPVPPVVALADPPLPEAPVTTYAGSAQAAPQQVATASQRRRVRTGRVRIYR